MDMKKYIPEKAMAQLEQKGWDKASIEEKVKEFYDERVKIGFEGDALEKSLKSRVKGYFGPILRRNDVSMKAIIYSVSEVVDENDRMRKFSESKEGNSGYRPNTDYVVEKGKYPWGGLQGQEIPMDPQYQQSGFIGIQYNDKLYNRNVVIQGNFLSDSNKAVKAGDVIRINIDPNRLDSNVIFVNNYEFVETMKEDKYKSLIENQLCSYHKTIEEIADDNYRGFVIVKGNVSELNSTNYGFTFDIVDDVDNWDIENSLVGYMQNVDFIDGAENVIFIGECFNRKESGYGLNIQKTIVPDEYKKKDLPQENIDEISNEFDNTTEEIDDDLL